MWIILFRWVVGYFGEYLLINWLIDDEFGYVRGMHLNVENCSKGESFIEVSPHEAFQDGFSFYFLACHWIYMPK